MRARAILTTLAVIVVLALIFVFVVRPRQQELSRVEEAIVAEQNRTTQLQNELARLQQLQEDAPELQAQLTEVRQLVPQRDNVANFIFQVQEAANAAGLSFARIIPELPKPPPEGAPLAEVRVTIGAVGTYFPIQDFVRRLYRLDRALRIDLISVKLDEAGGSDSPAGYEVELNATSRIFFELPPTATTGTTTTPGTTTPTTTPATPAPTPAATTPPAGG